MRSIVVVVVVVLSSWSRRRFGNNVQCAVGRHKEARLPRSWRELFFPETEKGERVIAIRTTARQTRARDFHEEGQLSFSCCFAGQHPIRPSFYYCSPWCDRRCFCSVVWRQQPVSVLLFSLNSNLAVKETTPRVLPSCILHARCCCVSFFMTHAHLAAAVPFFFIDLNAMQEPSPSANSRLRARQGCPWGDLSWCLRKWVVLPSFITCTLCLSHVDSHITYYYDTQPSRKNLPSNLLADALPLLSPRSKAAKKENNSTLSPVSSRTASSSWARTSMTKWPMSWSHSSSI